MTLRDVARLACPACGGGLGFHGSLSADHLERGRLLCDGCGRPWPVRDGLPELVDEAEVRGLDRIMRFVYDRIAPVHDPATYVLLPLLQGSSEAATRDGHMRRLRLWELAAENGRPPAILEIGVGSGGNLPWVERDLPRGLEVEIWGVDLSRQMIEYCRRRLARGNGRAVRLALADGHALPFPDGTFDRVYNVGGMGTYRDPRRALAEMARVARPGTPIVVVDEQLDPHADHSLYHRLMFRALTLYDPSTGSPAAYLPRDAVDVIEEQVSRFYYCLTFTVSPARTRS
jgi:ubiquinone/menaquinone biosynthesis C-methylase UbiE/uncharacterized protein YbaR (Trm112 family)